MKNFTSCLRGFGIVGVLAVSFATAGSTLAYVDGTAPIVGSVTPTSAYVSTPITLSGSYSDDVGATFCQFVELPGPTLLGTFIPSSPLSGTATLSYAFATAGSHTVQLQCRDAAGNWGSGASTYIDVATTPAPDTTAPSIGSISPTSAIVGTPVTLSAGFSDAVGATFCQFVEMPGSSLLGTYVPAGGSAMNGTATLSYSFSVAGSHTVQAQCRDAAGNWGAGASTYIDVATPPSDVTAPSVGSIAPTSATAGTTVTYSASFSDAVGVTFCQFVESPGSSLLGTSVPVGGSAVNGSATLAYSFSAGSHAVQVQCRDAVGNWGSGSVTTITVSSAAVDTTPPSIGEIFPLSIQANSDVLIYVNVSDNVYVDRCELYRNSSYYATMSINRTVGQSYLTVNFPSGSYAVKARCVDSIGNVAFGAERTLIATASYYGSDTSAPSVGIMNQSSVIVGTPATLSLNVTDNVGVSQCTLYVNGVSSGDMTLYSGYASRTYTFSYTGSYGVYATCRDAAGNAASGALRTVSVVSASSSGLPTPGSLIKLVCPSDAPPDHRCKAVYYYGSDGRRHPFPNAKVYFTWYPDFSQVLEVSEIFMSSLPLGKNVVYRPGTRMVKFTTLNRVYAVAARGILRWVTSEALAASMYGPNWNQQIDDISDVFYMNYAFGSDITLSSSFFPGAESAGTTSIDANL